ncbi:MAG: PKD domain-containing protein [Cyclobacteriaceae bacterium]
MRKFLTGGLFFLLMVAHQYATAQCAASFDVDPSVCSNSNLTFNNITAGATSYEWDFCSGDLANTPAAQSAVSSSLLFRARSVKVKREASGNYVGFALSEPNGQLIRMNFGNSLLNTPSLTNLGNFSNNIERAWGFTLYEENGNWYCFVPDFADGSLIKLSFGSSLLSAPVMQNLGNFSGALKFPGGMSIVSEGGNVFGFVCNAGPGASEVLKLDFGNSVNNAPAASVIPVPGGNFLMDISFIKECDEWIALATSFDNRKVFYLDFTTGLANSPTVGELNLPNLQFNPCAISVQREGGNYYAFTQHIDGWVFRIDFGASILDHTGVETNLGTLGISSSNFALDIIHEGSDWYGFSIDLSGSVTPGEGRLMRLHFPDTCNVNIKTFVGQTPPIIRYTSAGTYTIALTTQSAAGFIGTISKSVIVSALPAPDIDFTSQNICVNHDVLFASQNVSGNINTYAWTFGDGGSSALQNPTYQYTSTGTINPKLTVTATNGCQNYATKAITIYNQPVANFTAPAASPLCTNQNLLFTNTTPDIGITPTWDWSIDGVQTAATKDLSHAFTSTATQQVTLTASIPGCQTQKNTSINSLVAGPLAAFTVTGKCEDSTVSFTNNSSGSVTGYQWNFGDGQTSVSTSPVNTFGSPGTFNVVLIASNAAGCNNSASQQLTIYSAPQVNFAPLAPPFSCSGTTTQFNDLTPPPSDSNLSSWLWNFGDSGSPSNTSTQKNAQHMYATAGDYNVSLTVTSNFSCSTTLQKAVTIYQTPTIDFAHSALCEDSGVTFSDATPGHTAWNWQIGSSFYTTENATHIFSNPGTFNVTLSATASNNCIGATTKPVTIAPKLAVDFSSTKTCVNQDAQFTNLTDDATDPITALQWNFGGLGTSLSDPATFRFVDIGTANVTLTVTTTSGCQYPITKAIGIASGPLAAFTADPNLGETPLVVSFTNTSLNANSFSWRFGDSAESTSIVQSPSFTYTTAGDYTVALIATDVNNCADTTRQLIQALQLPEVTNPYPNPGPGKFFIEWNTSKATPTVVAITDATGRQIREFEVAAEVGRNRYVLDITGEHPGLYILTIRYLTTLKTYRLMVSE